MLHWQLSFTCFPEFANFHSRQQMIGCIQLYENYLPFWIALTIIANNRVALWDVLCIYLFPSTYLSKKISSWMAKTLYYKTNIYEFNPVKIGKSMADLVATTSDIADLGDGEGALAILGSATQPMRHSQWNDPRERTTWRQIITITCM